MSSAAADRRPPPLRLESIPSIDLRLLSQSELYSLSLCSDSTFDLNRCDDVVIPKINRSVFNESAGSRKQTYSRLRLAPPESSTTTTIHRRTPHLRSTHTPHSNNINDPEQAENSQIIATLKQLFKSDPNFEDLVSIEDDNNNFDTVVPELDHENLAIKRKRGRPRKHENLIFLRPPAAKRFRNNTVKKVVVYDDDKDIEIVNHSGVEVNLEILAGLEDPYGPEIRRRTEGMSSEDELLGFLRGLNGQWGSRRKKRRVVDASDFGDALPNGWKLSLCIKKKDGRVWLFCRRYLSPSGRQFESCKEISTYLLSITGGRSLDKPNQAQINNCDDFALKGASGNAADLILQEDFKRDGAVHNPSPPPPPPPPNSLPTHHEKQVTLDIEGSVDVQVGELFKCLKCSMIFEGKDDLLDHQVLAHGTERSQLGTAITDWVVVEDGTFECQICHKIFNQRNQYNVHVGAHVKHEIKNAEASLAQTAEMDVDPVFMTGPDKESPASVSSEGNVVVETYDARSGDKVRPASPHSNYKISSGSESSMDELVHDLNIVAHGKQDGLVNINGNILVEESCDKPGNNCDIDDEEVPKIGSAPDVAVPQSYFFLGHEASLSINESSGKPETSGGTHVDGADHKSGGNFDQGISSASFPLSPFPNEQIGSASGDGKEVVGMSASVEVLNQDAISETEVTHVGCADDKSEHILEQGRSSGSCLISTFPNEQTGNASSVGKDVIDMSASNKVLNHAPSEIGVLKSGICEKKGFGTNRDEHISSTSDELTSEKEKVVHGESSSGFFHRRIGLDEDGATEVKKFSTSASHSLVLPSTNAVNTVNSASIKSSEKQESPQKGGFGSRTLVPSVHKIAHDTDNNVNRLSSGLSSSRLGQFEVRSNAFDSYGASGMEGVSTFVEESNFKSSSLSPWQEEEYASKSVVSNVSIPSMEVPRMKINSDSCILQPGCEQNCHIENNVEKVSSNKAEEANDDFQIIRNNEPNNNGSVAPLGSSQNGNTGVLDFNTRNNLEFCSLVPSGNEQAFGFQDDVTCLYNSAMEECKQESSERGLLNHFYIADTSDDIFENKMYSTPLDELKFDEDRDIGSHDLSLAFRSPHHTLYADTINVEQKKDLVNCSVVPSKIKETFDVQTNLSMVNNSMVEDLKAGRDSVGGLFSLSRNNATSGFQSNANTAYPGRAWEGLKSDEFRISESKKFMSGFGSNHSQPNEEIVPSGMWKTGVGNQLQSGLTNPSHAQIQSPSCFHSFDIMSDKAEDGLFRLDERYNDGLGVSGLRSGRSEPVEFSFLTSRSEHNPNALQGDSRVFSYNTEMEQEFDSSFWLGKNSMMPSMAGRNQVTIVCAWCRNEFHLQPLHSGTQAGIGSLCPACSAGISGHVNML